MRTPVTEQVNDATTGLDRMSTLEAARVICNEDKRVAEAVERVLPQIAAAVDVIAARLGEGGRLFYLGTGTSGRLGVLDASECPPTFGASPELIQGVIAGGYDACFKAVEASEDEAAAGPRDLQARGVGPGDAVVGLTASGTTPYTVAAVRWAREIGAATIGITCNDDTPLHDAAEITIAPIVGPEVVAGSTRMKAGTAQKLVLNMISTLTMSRLGYLLGNRMGRMQPRNAKLIDRAEKLLESECGVTKEAARHALAESDGQLPVALVSLKLGLSTEEARERLEKAGGSLDAALDG